MFPGDLLRGAWTHFQSDFSVVLVCILRSFIKITQGWSCVLQIHPKPSHIRIWKTRRTVKTYSTCLHINAFERMASDRSSLRDCRTAPWPCRKRTPERELQRKRVEISVTDTPENSMNQRTEGRSNNPCDRLHMLSHPVGKSERASFMVQSLEVLLLPSRWRCCTQSSAASSLWRSYVTQVFFLSHIISPLHL